MLARAWAAGVVFSLWNGAKAKNGTLPPFRAIPLSRYSPD